jgi:hypothetical protein
MIPRMIAPWQLLPAGNLRQSSYLDTQDERPQHRSAGEGAWGRFSGLRGWGRMQIARSPFICVRATRPPRCSRLHDQSHRRHHVPALTRRPQKITFGEMRSSGVRGIPIYCADFRCSHSIRISADRWSDHIRLSDLEPRLVCKVCGKRSADMRPDFRLCYKFGSSGGISKRS